MSISNHPGGKSPRYHAERWILHEIQPPMDMWADTDFIAECDGMITANMRYVDGLLTFRAKQAALVTLATSPASMEDDRARVGLMKVKADILKTVVDSGRSRSESQPSGSGNGQSITVNFTEAKRESGG